MSERKRTIADIPELAAGWDYEANGDLTPQQVSAGSSKKVHWVCAVDDRHRWQAAVCDRTRSDATGCPVCSGRRVLSGVNDLATTHPELAAEWDQEVNGDLTPQQVTAGSGMRAHWVCAADSRHRWTAIISSRGSTGAGCPVCAGRQALPGVNDLATTHPQLVAQ